jgi:hypothetical protein
MYKTDRKTWSVISRRRHGAAHPGICMYIHGRVEIGEARAARMSRCASWRPSGAMRLDVGGRLRPLIDGRARPHGPRPCATSHPIPMSSFTSHHVITTT